MDRYKCILCPNSYCHKRSLTYHLKTSHGVYENVPDDRLRVSCQEEECLERFSSSFELVQHLMEFHNKHIEQVTMSFNAHEDFIQWKSDIERDTSSRFVSKRSWSKKNGSIGRVYNCNRSGIYKPTVEEEKRRRKIKAQGSRKIGQLCPARIFVTQHANGTIDVMAILTHYGHDCDLNHLSFSKEDRSLIQGKLAMGISPQRIMQEIKCGMHNGNMERINLVNNKDLSNMLTSLKKEVETNQLLKKEVTPLPVDAATLQECLEELGELPDAGPVRIEVLSGPPSKETKETTVKHVSKLCQTLQGSLLTYDVSQHYLQTIEHKLKSCVAICHTHGKRQVPPFPFDIAKGKRGRPRKRPLDAEKPAAATGKRKSIGGVAELNGHHVTEDVGFLHDVERRSVDEVDVEFLKKVCNSFGVAAATIGYKVKLTDVAFPGDLQSYDRDILDIDVDRIVQHFEPVAAAQVAAYVRCQRDLWRCAICCETREAEMIECSKCPRWFHFSCVGLTDIPEIWTCAGCM